MENKNLDKYRQLKKQIRKNKKFILRHGRTALIYHYWNSMTTNGNFDIHNPLKFNEKLQRRK